MSVTIYHNPRCSKSRAALQLLEDKNLDLNIIRYLDAPLGEAELRSLLAKLGLSARDVMRKGEVVYKDLELADPARTEDELIAAIAANPILLERAIVVAGDKAVVARPPEKVLDIV